MSTVTPVPLTFQNAFLDELLRFWTMCQLLVQTVCSHVLLQLSLLGLYSRGGGGVGKDVPYQAPDPA